MQSRNDVPNLLNFNFAVDSVFTFPAKGGSVTIENDFLLLDGTNFLLLDGTDFLLLGT